MGPGHVSLDSLEVPVRARLVKAPRCDVQRAGRGGGLDWGGNQVFTLHGTRRGS